MPKWNEDRRKCDGFCNEFFNAGEMTFAGIIPGRGECYFCPKCHAERKQAMKRNADKRKSHKIVEDPRMSFPGF